MIDSIAEDLDDLHLERIFDTLIIPIPEGYRATSIEEKEGRIEIKLTSNKTL